MRQGFSLIEVLVSLSIFTVVVTISVGVLMVLINANSRSQNVHSVMNNVSFALDSITREIRTGSDYFCSSASALPVSGETTRNCESGGAALSFNEGGRSLTGNASSPRIAVRLANGMIERRLGNGDGDADPNEDSDWIPLTAPDITITDLLFYVSGATPSDTQSPTVTIYVEGVSGADEEDKGVFHIQTTVVQQLLDI